MRYLITVSEAIAKEAECILGRKADFVIPNGMNFDQITSREDLAKIHRSSRGKINQFAKTYFNPYYNIDYENLLVVHISGRYEFHNKGVDVFIEALQEVNNKLKTSKTVSKEILAFIWIPAPISGTKQFIARTFEEAKVGTKPQKEEGIDNPPICPFILNEKDTILCALKDADLLNKQEDKVKVIFYPTYLSKNDQLLELDYYDAVSGCDMGIYPSTYEPFGLTPLEAMALGVPAVTTDLSGFGLLVNELQDIKTNGIHVLNRRGKSNSFAAKELANTILKHAKMTDEDTQSAKTNARDISELYSWRNIIKEYLSSYVASIKKKK